MMEINEEMGYRVMRLCRAEDYGELHRLLIGRIAYKEGVDEGNSILHDIADILKLAKDDFPVMTDRHYLEWTQAVLTWKNRWLSQFREEGKK